MPALADAAEDEAYRPSVLAHELRNAITSAELSFELLADGHVSVNGSTSQSHRRSLARLGDLIERALTDVRLSSGVRAISASRTAAKPASGAHAAAPMRGGSNRLT